MITDIMLDLETLNTIDSAIVLSIGAFGFNRYNINDNTSDFHESVGTKEHRDEQRMFGRTSSKETISWWKKQSKAAQQIFRESTCKDTVEMLGKFADFYKKHNEIYGVYNVKVWGNGATFDNTILASLYRSYALDVPWNQFDDGCYRTVKGLCGVEAGIKNVPFEGVKHNALHDARHQAKLLCLMINSLKKKGVKV